MPRPIRDKKTASIGGEGGHPLLRTPAAPPIRQEPHAWGLPPLRPHLLHALKGLDKVLVDVEGLSLDVAAQALARVPRVALENAREASQRSHFFLEGNRAGGQGVLFRASGTARRQRCWCALCSASCGVSFWPAL